MPHRGDGERFVVRADEKLTALFVRKINLGEQKRAWRLRNFA